MSDLKTPLAKVRGMGSAKDGTHHWWIHRVTGIAQIPLVIFFVVSMVGNAGGDYESWMAWLQQPLVAVMMILFVANTCFHFKLGLTVLIEDYVHEKGMRLLCMLAVTFGSVALATVGIFSILKISFGG